MHEHFEKYEADEQTHMNLYQLRLTIGLCLLAIWQNQRMAIQELSSITMI